MNKVLSALHNLFTQGSTLSKTELLERQIREREWFKRTKESINGIFQKYGLDDVTCHVCRLKSVHGGPYLDLMPFGRFSKDKADAYFKAVKEIKRVTGVRLCRGIEEEFDSETNSFVLNRESYEYRNRVVSCETID